jgi:hypothetical protein
MTDALTLGGIGLAIFSASALVGFVLQGGIRSRSTPPPPNTRIRLKKGAAVYSCHLIEAERKRWKVTAPISKSDVVSLHPGGTFVAEFALPAGVAVFTTQVVGREADPEPALWIEAPPSIKARERRQRPRIAVGDKVSATLGSGLVCKVRDLGTGGAKVISSGKVAPGEPILLTPQDSAVSAIGWALDCVETDCRAYPFVIRVAFAEPMPLEWVWRIV